MDMILIGDLMIFIGGFIIGVTFGVGIVAKKIKDKE
ncbi:MAG: hypothetical protein ACD_41C00343G0001 [uncultured bacterium]|nr:MAG: hypothetical protein ACD_41C00343G0001 [uncultured bacterium]